MNSQLVLYIQIFLGVAFVVYFFLSRGKPQQPTQLNVKANEDFSKSIIKTQSVASNSAAEIPQQPTSQATIIDLPVDQDEKVQKRQDPSKMTVLEPENVIQLKDYHPQAKNLSIYFVYNGHEWESHEVLGVPAGASMPKVTEAYQRLIIASDPSTFEFFESAYQSILKKWRDRL